MSVTVYDREGKESGQVELPASVFNVPVNEAVLHQAVLRQQANERQGTNAAKTRGEVSGGGKKPWKQKGTGRARQGSTRAPQWRHGGVVFGPHPRSYEQKMPRKQRRVALRAALSAKHQEGAVRVIDRKSTRLNSSHEWISYAVFCLKKKKKRISKRKNE